MGVQLQIVPLDDATPASPEVVRLPQVRMIPTDENLPHLRSLSVVIGPDDLLPAVADRLRESYHQGTWPPPGRPYKLTRVSTIRKREWLDVSDLTEPVDARVVFKLEFQDSDAAGDPGPGGRTETAVLNLKLAPVPKPSPVVPPRPPRIGLSVDPLDLRLSDAGPVGTIRIEVRGSHEVPRVRVRDGSRVDGTPLRRRFDDALVAPPKRVGSGPGDGVERYEITLQPAFNSDDRDVLERVVASGVVEVPLRTTCEGGVAVDHRILIEDADTGAPIRIAIDFGTSYTTATVYDPTLIDETIIDGSSDAAPRRLPVEQEQWLAQGLDAWLSSLPEAALPGVVDPGQRLDDLKSGLADLRRGRTDSAPADLFETIQHLATRFRNSPELLRVVGRKLVELFHDALRVPPMRSLNMRAVPLEMDSTELPSDIEIVGRGPGADDPPEVRMGNRARQDLRKALKEARTATEGAENRLQAVRSRFHPAPKRYLGKTDPVTITYADGSSDTITLARIVQGAYAFVREQIEQGRAKAPAAWSPGELRKAIVTYPTTALPKVRSDLEAILTRIGFRRVITDYDEAIAAAIFYLMREIGFDPSLGLEAFKVGCRFKNGAWWRNVLVFDIGGGTTDLALVRLTLTEDDPFKGKTGADGERGAGGRYYVIEPRLLGSSGHLQLGGDLATLRVFQLLKAAVADRTLAAVRDGWLTTSGTLAGREKALPDLYRPDGRYADGSLFKAVLGSLAKPNPANDESFKSATDAINLVIPTRWKNSDSSGLDPFSLLREVAEKFKIALGSGPREKPVMYLPDETVLDILRACSYDDVALAPPAGARGAAEPIDLGASNGDLPADERPTVLGVKLSQEEFKFGVRPVINQAFAIAKGLLSSRLAQKTGQSIQDGEVPPEPGLDADVPAAPKEPATGDPASTEPRRLDYKADKPERVDWLVLSGQTCNLNLVEEERRVVLNSPKLAPDRVIFDRIYAKRATVIGACYAERLRSLRFDPQGAIPTLRDGKSQFYFKIKNLFFFLPCAFEVLYVGGHETIFHANEELHLIDETGLGKARSFWRSPQPDMVVYRRDYDNANENYWGSYDIHDHDHVMQALGLGRDQEEAFLARYRVRFEVNSRLEFRLFFCQGDPHYAVPVDLGLNVRGKPDGSSAGEGPWGAVPFDLALDVHEGTVEEQKILLRAGTPLGATFVDGEGQQRKGIIAARTVPVPPASDMHQVFVRESDKAPWNFVAELPHARSEESYIRRCRLTLDDRGQLIIHRGEVRYSETSRIEDFKGMPSGTVLVQRLTINRREDDKYRDLYSGLH